MICALALAAGANAATFGMNVAGLFPTSGAPPTNVAAALQSLRETGATVARSDTLWETAEPNAPVNGVATFNWSYDDQVVGTLAKAGLRWQPILDYATNWAATANGGSNPGVDPSHNWDFAVYARAFALRYGVGGSFWKQNPDIRPVPVRVFEIWNEPDLSEFWGPNPDLNEYATLYLDARSAIRAVQSTAKVIIGGLVFPRQTLPTLIQDHPELSGHVDGIGVHPYRSTLADTIQSVAYDLQTDAATFGVPLYVNEYGWWQPSPYWPDDTEAVRDANLEQATAELGANPYIADVEPYCWFCQFPYNIYGTPAAFAFAAGIQADASPSVRPGTTSPVTPVAKASGPPGQPSATTGKPSTAKRAKHRAKRRRPHLKTKWSGRRLDVATRT